MVDCDNNKNMEKILPHHTDIKSVNKFTKIITFYNPTAGISLHKYWFKIPRAKLLKKKNIKCQNMITVVLSNDSKNLVNCIQSLDNKIMHVIKKCFKKNQINMTKSIKLSKNFPPVMEMIADKQSKLFHDNKKECNFADVGVGKYIDIVIEFDCVTINGKQGYKKWRIVQLMELQSIDLSIPLFSSDIQQDVPYVHAKSNHIKTSAPFHSPHTRHVNKNTNHMRAQNVKPLSSKPTQYMKPIISLEQIQSVKLKNVV